MRRSVTIKDVAREAGVSIATVSRVWNGSGLVSDETRQRVDRVAARLGYTPNGAARSLITNRTQTIGVLLPDLYGEFFSELIRGIDQTARAHGYHLLVSSSHADREELVAALRAMRGRVDGLIVMSPDVEMRTAVGALPDGLPTVLINSPGGVPQGDADVFTVDGYAGTRAMVRHLVDLGHRRIAIIRGPADNHDAAERLRGFRAALRSARIARDAALEIPGDFGEASGWAAALTIAALTPRPTAILATNDMMAIGALSALRELAIDVPGEIAVAGFDDIPLARYMNPPLSSVHVDISALGARATARLVERLALPRRARSQLPVVREIVPTRLAIRRSCGAERTSATAPA